MYKISVPLGNETLSYYGCESSLVQVKRFDAERVFMSMEFYETDPEKRRKALAALKENTEFFKSRGYEVGAWIWTFMFAGNTPFQCMTGIDGAEFRSYACPRDPDFLEFSAEYIKDIAKCGVDMIMFDDDFRYGYLGSSPACLCKYHIKAINEEAGGEYGREEIRKHILTGGKNKIRDAYIKANGDALKAFSENVRAAVDEIDPDIRVGLCTCMTGWDLDGVDAAQVARILAGKTKPFVRLIGAPYWAVLENWGHKLQDVIDMERMEGAWTKADDIEVMAEGDPFPRPRMNCPASYLEGFDTAIRASGCTDGILKYGVDYYSKPDTEQGYAKAHEKNRAVYEWIDRNFKGKTDGVRVYAAMKKLADTVSPTKVNENFNPERLSFPIASRTLSFCSIPVTYEGAGVCGACFDENARALPESALDNGLIMDIAAAEILTERGFDVGVRSVGEPLTVESEYFTDGERIRVRGARTYDIALDEKAEILSYALSGDKRIPLSAYYENGKGQRFLLLNFNTEKSAFADISRHYKRSRQYADAIERISGKKPPAYVYGAPSLYIMCRREEESGALAVGFWNFFADPVYAPFAELDGEYTVKDSVNCTAEIKKDRLYLSDIPAFGFAAVKLIKR